PYIGEGTVVVGSAKISRIEQDREEAERKHYELEHVEHALATLQAAYESRQKVLGAEFETEKHDLMRKVKELKRQASQVVDQRETMRGLRE
ncbi:MAG: hypothetical protein PVJ68_13195, partial [Candidatus Thiodiazotropha sp.]